MDKEYILGKLRENREYFSKYGVTKNGLFGSYVSGEVTEESDTDILIKMEENQNNYFNYCYVLYFLEDLFNKKIDLVNATNDILNYKVPQVKEHFEKVRKEILESVLYA